ncbi:colicin immunity domain-containing protein [Buttiauxella sp. WJP83]|uniref:colicin immunity domain-containing protein n=1 Tax=Buttiauxella sp. WJP83 TaxID=2986951 RepID=UPI0022DD4854|nr:colicin immunity domain-containing protein [Buttiauxella sp. WJP83]WBM70734.1 colicin immunity domain-containing protein [Buttiauxella sp. WJP83]
MSFNQSELAILTLIDSFISGDLAAPEFESRYSISWREYRDSDVPKSTDKDTQRYFDSVFSAVDSYCADPDLLDEDDLDAQGLLDCIQSLKSSWKGSALA